MRFCYAMLGFLLWELFLLVINYFEINFHDEAELISLAIIVAAAIISYGK